MLGILQGLTEFLPVSSSGHLVLLQNFFGIKEPELLFDISLHIGTLLAVCIVFFKELKEIFSTLIRLPMLIKQSDGLLHLYRENEPIRLVVLIVIGTIPTGILGILFQDVADHIFGSVWIVGIMFLITGTILKLTKRVPPKGRPVKEMGLKDALAIGLIQGLAVLPGLSRSGSTISAALFLKVDRELAGRYSFLLSIPTILGAFLTAMKSDMIHSTVSREIILIGTATAAVVGFAALKLLLHIVKRGQLHLFGLYCWLAGILVLFFS
jgi:undecaprenyl-diphosphatase